MTIRCSVPSFRTVVTASAVLLCIFPASSNFLHAQRLPETVRPEKYTLTLQPDLQAATFTGIETIDVILAEPTDSITLNAAEITFQAVWGSSGPLAGKLPNAKVTLDKEKEQATFTFPYKLPAGKATLFISYTGILNNELRGFYLSKTDRRNYAVSQFESTDARRAFPSFDEPAMKATYDISLIVDSNDTAISNGPILSDTPGPGAGKHTLHFAVTPKMSTYLVAFLVGDFQCSAGKSDGVAIRVCATPDKVALTTYGVDIAKWMLHYYNSYFGIPYPLKKLDLIALPDFEAGAMENFGAITYRESDLLLNEKTASIHAKKEVALVIAHEMAHQWFGDLVTMQWWDNVWLNEGFATWMENKATAHMHPEWNIDQAVAGDLQDTLNLDAQPTTRTIRAKADTPDEIEQMFDSISYNKAGAVLSSVENYLGEETFRKGVHNYLAAHLYANATAEDFWGAQTAFSHKPVDKIMESLVTQPGVPILSFGSTLARIKDPTDAEMIVNQKRFFLSPHIQSNYAQQWTLPVCFKTSTGQDCQVLTPSTGAVKVPTGTILFADAGGKGYYRSAYRNQDYAALLASVESTLTASERIALLGDEWAQVGANRASVGDYLDLVAAIKTDSNAEVIDNALRFDPNTESGGNPLEAFGAIYSQIASTAEEKAQLAAWIRATFAPQYAKLAPPSSGDSVNIRELRAKLFTLLGLYGKDPAVEAQARPIASQFLTDPASVDTDLGKAALSVAAIQGNAAFFDHLQKIFETSTDPEMKESSLRAMTQFEDPALLERALDYLVSGKVRNQDVARVLARALRSDESRDLAWKYIQSHWEKVQAQMTTGSGSRLIPSTGNFCSAQARDEVKSFFFSHKVAASDQALRHAIERIDGCIELRSLQEPRLRQWLAAQPKS
jgi:aminopeptidase N/puromycin-sensitive aminopeptidase